MHERMGRMLMEEATISPANTQKGQQRKFNTFREEFNQVRVHEALGMNRPGDVYRVSILRMPKRIETYNYPTQFLVRRVSSAGTIQDLHDQVFVSNTSQEDYVGLEEVDDGVYDLYFCFYQLGRYELRRNKIHGMVSQVALTLRRIDHCRKV